MQKILQISFRILFAVSALLFLTPVATANNSVVLLVEQPSADNLPLTIATTQSALQNFVKTNGSDAEIAVINYSTTADVLQPFGPLTSETSNAVAYGLKTAGSREDSINTASGMERAIALLNAEAKSGNKKVLLVVSDANISTGDKDLDAQFTEWLTEIISEDAVNSEIDVRWHPITQNANHTNIDAFLEKLNGRRVVLSPEPELIEEAAAPPPKSTAELQLEIITSQLENEAANPAIADEPPQRLDPTPAVTESLELSDVKEEVDVAQQAAEREENPVTQLTQAVEPVSTQESPNVELAEAPVTANDSTISEPIETPVVLEQPAESANIETVTESESETESQATGPGFAEQVKSLLTPSNIKIAILLIIAIAATFLLKALLNKRRESSIRGTGLADKEYRDSSDVAVAVSSVAAVTTRANAPIIPPREPTPAPMPAPTKTPEPEPIPTPLSATNNTASSAISESENAASRIGDDIDEDPMDGTQEVFSDFSSASLSAAPIAAQEPESEPKASKGPSPTPDPDQPDIAIADTPLEVDPYATVIAEAPDFAAMAGAETVLADEPEKPVQDEVQAETSEPSSETESPEIDPYATVIADASQIKAYAKKFSSDADDDSDEDDPDATVLYRPDKDN